MNGDWFLLVIPTMVAEKMIESRFFLCDSGAPVWSHQKLVQKKNQAKFKKITDSPKIGVSNV